MKVVDQTKVKKEGPLKRFNVSAHGDGNSRNLIIHGDNREVLKQLKFKYEGKVKCIYIDPPYNNGEQYTHYHDDEHHDIWLDAMVDVLFKLKPLLSIDGSVWISIDDSEMHYLKVAADKVFGRKNFITTIVWQQRTTRENRKVFSNNHEYILVYAKNPEAFGKNRNLLPSTSEVVERYKNPDNDPRGLWQSVSANVQAGHASCAQFYKLRAPNGKIHEPPHGRCWVYNEIRMKKEIKNNNIWFGKDGNGVPRIKKFLSQSNIGLTPETLWLADDSGTNKMAKKHSLQLFPNEPIFDTPKPEQLLQKILHIATNEGDLVLDPFLGSGTTAATAHKMKRSYIGIEIGDHVEYAVSRIKQVIGGEKGGNSKTVGWVGGGGFNVHRTNKE